ncbi:ribonucleoside hydrolase RihC [Rubripirellula lacrimiformis]|uniref:Ribonucleoside hydrolase RihC n=1 Tax=Rubripirellula lacrimiformis TaxID=1930273 RepID=A0A517N522_9BACT|nr:nucleoside hydrolase [Rubripirellula lacrimiformis]QDT02233.1 ribonucleoside hydrolase RihC [Rubripirellula lacrimiformis]
MSRPTCFAWPILLATVMVSCVSANAAAPVKVILDTDMASDCDDAGAIAVLHALADTGEAEILAVVTNCKASTNASCAAVDTINTFYGRGDIPIGSDKDGHKTSWGGGSAFTPGLRDRFPHDALPDDQMPDAGDVYRDVLSSQEDGSVVICSVGALSNLEDLIQSPDGLKLVQQKVRQLVVMGGQFPESDRPETNIRLDPSAAVAVVNRWPTPILWQGFEVGAALICGDTLKSQPDSNPVKLAFALRPFGDGKAIDHGKPAHDQAAVLLAVRGTDPTFWQTSEAGRVVIDSDGHSRWKYDRRGDDHYVRIVGTPDRLTQQINELMTTR